MPDENEGVEKTVEETTVSVPQDEVQEETQDQTGNVSDDIPETLPEDPEKQREAFIKMRKALKAQKSQEREEFGESVLNELRQPSNYQVAPITPDTDIEQVTARMSMAERRAMEADSRSRKLEIELENQRLFKVAPELDPDHPDFKKPETKILDEYIAGQIVLARQMGKSYDIAKLARKAKELFSEMTQSQKQQAAEEAIDKLQKKELGSLEAKGNSISIPRTQDMESLKQKVRLGDERARTEYLKHLIPDDI